MKNSQPAVQATVQRNEFVSIRNNQVVTTSLRVAEIFGKEHKNVLQEIRNLECSSKFIELNFQPYHYFSELNPNVIRKLPMYYLTRDGFTFLAMGFTGKIAARFKEDYINAFNEMEKALTTGQNNSETILQLKKFCERYTSAVRGILKDCQQRFGTCGTGDIPIAITYHDEWSLTKNLDYILPRLQCAFADGLYAMNRNAKTERELQEIRHSLSSIMGTLYRDHHIFLD